MFLAVLKARALPTFRKNSFGLIAVLCSALVANAGPIISPAHFQISEGLRFELPANGNLRIENLRGGVIVEVWSENFVSLAAITDSGHRKRRTGPDTEQRGGNVLDWHLQGGAGERVADGVYLCVLTIKNLSGRLSQKLGRVTVSGQSTVVRSAIL